MKLLYFSDNTSGHNQRFLQKLSEAGLDVWFLDPTCAVLPDGWLPESVHWIQPKQTLPRNSDPATFSSFLPQFLDLLKEICPDLVHAGPIQTCGYVTALSGFHPWLLTSWGSDILLSAHSGPDWEQATRLSLSSADGFFCDCDTVRTTAKTFADLKDSRIVQLPWGIKKGVFDSVGILPSNEEYRREPNTFAFICTRSWEPLYGIDTLLQAFLQAYRTNSSLRLILVAGGSQAGMVREFIRAHGLEQVVHCPGPQPKEEMPKWFRAAAAYVSCAKSDGTSVSLLEAMATGLPVVVTDIPSNREWVVDDHNGWLAPAGSADQFADRLLRARRLSEEERQLFSQRNRSSVDLCADWDRNFPRLLRMYEELVHSSIHR